MDFSLSDTQREIQELAQRVFGDYTTQERLRPLDDNGYFDADLWRQLGESGLLGIALAEAHGGMGVDFETLAVLLEEAGRYVAPLPLIPVLVTGALTLQQCSLREQAVALLDGVASGERMITAALNDIGSHNALHTRVTAKAVGNGWQLTGVKSAVPAATRAQAAWMTACTVNGLGIFLVELGAAGVTVIPQISTTGEYMGHIALASAPAQLLAEGEAAEAWVQTAQTLTWAAQAAQAVGLCAQMTRLGATYTSERVQFGKPIATFQAVAHTLANAHIATEALRSVTILAVTEISGGASPAACREAALGAKIFAGDTLHRVSHDVQQVHGGAGVDRDYPLFRFALAAKQLEISFGSSQQLLQVLGREIAEALA